MIEIRKTETAEVETFRDDILDHFAEIRGHPFGYDEFAFEALKDGTRIGTINGAHLYDWVYIEFLAVSESARGLGVGSSLMDAAEALARDQGGLGLIVDTFRYQAPEFYKARGYVERMVVPARDPACDRIYLEKRVATD